MKLAITVCATTSYCYAMKTLGRRVAACLQYADWQEPGLAVIAGDDSKECKKALEHWKSALPKTWEVVLINAAKENLAEANYKVPAQIILASLRTAAFSAARAWNADLCWSLDSDTLPPGNALRCMIDSLSFDRGYYSVATCPYPNEAFLGGFGTPHNPIAEDFLDSERIIPEDVLKEKAAIMEEMTAKEKEANQSKASAPTPEQKAVFEALRERLTEVNKKIKECPPLGNVFELNAKAWRRRGWLDNAYPGSGRGWMVPSDWCGFGCTMMNRAALGLADFDGYAGEGTEDLFICWHRWYPARLRINVIPHCPCDHVIWGKKKGGPAEEFTLIRSFHEEHGECVGHLRTRKMPWKEF